ncbi:TPM domain-containing protein [Flavobacterium defluvii]|uniref:TLP18.3, Psb32 and MOLO-1 founding protein of phosphatase n=1 Tax=Flavobacterium defluvii TaxID=370979 RepID=A0A1M5Q192_9FLAO|nr:TPM domain-containing protein [Flavobacterium defluvii]SHH07682.1 TLP18.3, Psb32 and MOLO-1 founding protein of phosphatase [Flavobacterium defluvii]
MKKIFFIIIIALFSTGKSFSQTKKENTVSDSQNVFSRPYDYVNDFEKILNPNQTASLTNTLKAFEKQFLYKITVVTTSTIQPYTSFPDYALELDKYLAKDPKLDPTILIVVSKELRQIQVQSIDLIRYKLSDNDTQSIITTYAVPEFKKGDYGKGLELAVEQIMSKLKTY